MQKWRFALMVINTDSAFNGGYFKASTLSQLFSFSTPPNQIHSHRPK